MDHPYIFESKGGVFSVITIPAAAGGAQATGINDKGSISGFYIDSTGKNHGFLISKGEFRTLDFPGSTLTQAFGLNNHDEVVGAYVDASGRSEEHTSELQSHLNLVCRLLLEKKNRVGSPLLWLRETCVLTPPDEVDRAAAFGPAGRHLWAARDDNRAPFGASDASSQYPHSPC